MMGTSYEDLIAMPKVVFTNEKKEIEVPQGANLRKEAMKAGIWPPDTSLWMTKMTNMLTIPASFSPLR